jgi:hypothetical protein
LPRPRKALLADVVLPDPDEHDRILLTGSLAAQVVGTTPRNIRNWRDKGWLPEVGQEPSGRRQFIYEYADVITADAIARGIAAAAA